MAKNSPLPLKMRGQTHVYEDHHYDFGVTEDETQMRIAMTEVEEERGAIWCRLTIHFINDDGSETWPPLYGPARVNLMRGDRGGMLGIIEQLQGGEFGQWDWEHMLTNTKNLTIKALEAQLPMTRLNEAAEKMPEAPYLAFPFIARSGVTVLYGDGGTGKSTLALALAIEVSTGYRLISENEPLAMGPVLYADYEDDDASHANRVSAIAKGHGIDPSLIDIYHVPLVKKLSYEAKRLRHLVLETGAELVILDSIGMGRGGDAVASEDTIRMFRSLRSLEVPVLAIDHISKQGKTQKSTAPDAYGSIYTRNSSRMMWFVERRAQRLGDPWDYLVFTHTKANHVRKQPPQYLKVKYVDAQQETSDGAVSMIHSLRFEPTDVHGVPDADGPSTKGTKIRIIDEIVAWIWAEGEAKSVKDVAEHLEKSIDTVRRTMNRAVNDGELVKMGGEEMLYDIPNSDEKPIPF